MSRTVGREASTDRRAGTVEQPTGALARLRQLRRRVEAIDRPSLVRHLASGGRQARDRQSVEAAGTPLECEGEVGAVGNDELGRGGRGRRPDVRGEVRERHVGLVAHATHERSPMADNRPYDGLVVECPQVLERSPAAGEDRDLRGIAGPALDAAAFSPAIHAAEPANDAGRRTVALDEAR